MRWLVTSWIFPIRVFKKKQHWQRTGTKTDLEGWSSRTLHLPLWLQMFSMPLTNASHWAQGNSWSFTGIHRQLQRIFLRIWQSFDVIFCWIFTSSAVWFSRAPSVAISTSLRSAVNPLLWVLLWTTRSRPIGVKVCLAAQFNFFSTAFDPRAWTMVVFWKENLGRQPQLITPENEGDETSCPSPPKFFDDPDVPFGPSGPPERPGPPGPPGQPGLPSGWPPAPSPAGDRERVGPESTSRERLPLRPSSPEPQLIPIPVNDGDDDQPTQAERQRRRSRSRERRHPHAQVPQEPQTQPLVNPEPDDVSDKDFSDMNPSSPSAEPPPSAEQRGRSRRDERSRSRERTPPHSSSHDADESSATVDPQNSVSDRSRSPQEQEASRWQDPQQQKGKEDCCRRTAEWFTKCQKAEVHWLGWRRRRTSKCAWNLLKHSAYCTSASLQLWWWRQWVQRWTKGTKLGLRKDLVLPRSLRSDEWWALDKDAEDTQAAAAGSFCFVTTENGDQQDKINLITMPCVQRSLYLNEVTNDFDSIKVEVSKEVDGLTRGALERCMATCGRAAGTRAKMRPRARKEASGQEVRGYY